MFERDMLDQNTGWTKELLLLLLLFQILKSLHETMYIGRILERTSNVIKEVKSPSMMLVLLVAPS